MVVFAVIALLLGVGIGYLGEDWMIVQQADVYSSWILSLLMFSVGISIGIQKDVFSRLKQYRWKAMIIPLGVMAGSLTGGAVCALFLHYPLGDGSAIGSCMGWYSLGGITIEAYSGERMGSIAFLSNLMRELLAFFTIPLLAKYLGAPSCIAVAGATSEDTTLPMMVKYTTEEYVILSVLNGFLCSLSVPVLIPLCYWLF